MVALIVAVTSTPARADAVSFPDPMLEAAVRAAIGKPTANIYDTDLSDLKELRAIESGISSLEGIQHCPSLTTLSLHSNEIVDISPLADLTALTVLDLGNNGITDISPLADLASLTALSLGSNDLVDISPLASLTNLTVLYLWGHNEIVDISPLASLTSLTTLSLYLNEIVDISPLAGLTQLTSLDLGGFDFVDISPLACLTNLATLDLRSHDIVDISPLADLTNLTTLDLGHNKIANISPLERLTHLATLDLGSNGISDISPLADLSNLTALDLTYNEIVDISSLAVLFHLTELDLAGNDIVDIGPLASLTSLKTLSLYSNEIVDISPLAGLTNLTTLELGLNDILDVSPLAGLTNLTELRTSSNEIVDISPLANLTNLTTLSLYSNKIVDISPLASLTSLTTLSLESNDIVDVRPLAGIANLATLWLNSNDIVDISPLAGLTNLTMLDLESNDIVDISPLTSLANLRRLELFSNQIVDISPLLGLADLRNVTLGKNWLDVTDGSPDMVIVEALRDRGVEFDTKLREQNEVVVLHPGNADAPFDPIENETTWSWEAPVEPVDIEAFAERLPFDEEIQIDELTCRGLFEDFIRRMLAYMRIEEDGGDMEEVLREQLLYFVPEYEYYWPPYEDDIENREILFPVTVTRYSSRIHRLDLRFTLGRLGGEERTVSIYIDNMTDFDDWSILGVSHETANRRLPGRLDHIAEETLSLAVFDNPWECLLSYDYTLENPRTGERTYSDFATLKEYERGNPEPIVDNTVPPYPSDLRGVELLFDVEPGSGWQIWDPVTFQTFHSLVDMCALQLDLVDGNDYELRKVLWRDFFYFDRGVSHFGLDAEIVEVQRDDVHREEEEEFIFRIGNISTERRLYLTLSEDFGDEEMGYKLGIKKIVLNRPMRINGAMGDEMRVFEFGYDLKHRYFADFWVRRYDNNGNLVSNEPILLLQEGSHENLYH